MKWQTYGCSYDDNYMPSFPNIIHNRSGSNLTNDIIVEGTSSSALYVPAVLKEEDVNSTTYDSIGSNYNQNRTADHRVLAVIKELLELPSGSTIADVGAGTGNYSNALADLGYKLEAVEPSMEMRRQAIPNPRVH